MSDKKKVEVSKKNVEDIVRIELERTNEIEDKRNELIKLSRIGSIDRTVQYINRATPKNIEKMFEQYHEQRLIKINEEVSKRLVSGVSQVLSALNLIGDAKALEEALDNDELLKEDILNSTGDVTQNIPYIGFISGGATISKHIYDHKYGGLEDTGLEVIKKEVIEEEVQ